MYILGINGTTYWAHNPAAALFEDGRIVAAAEEMILRVTYMERGPRDFLWHIYGLHDAGQLSY